MIKCTVSHTQLYAQIEACTQVNLDRLGKPTPSSYREDHKIRRPEYQTTSNTSKVEDQLAKAGVYE